MARSLAMRIRSKTNDSVLSPGGETMWKNETMGGSLAHLGYSDTRYSYVDYEEMTDDPSKNRQSKSLIHRRFYHTCGTPDLIRFTYSGNTYVQTGPNVYDTWNPPAFYLTVPGTRYGLTEQEQINNTMDRFLNTNDVDNLLNVVEAPQLPASILGLLDTSRSPSARVSLGKVANGFLAYSFGLAPLLADMKKTAKILKDYNKDLKRALSSAGKIVTVRTRLSGQFDDFASGVRFGSTYQTIHQSTLSKPLRIVSISGKNTVRFNSAILGSLNYSMSRLGSGGPASFVWEKIPYSFMVDWFVDLRGILNNLDNLLTGSSKKVTDACVSEKFSVKHAFKHTNAYSSSQSIIPAAGEETHSSTLVSYTRKPLDPRSSTVVSKGRFGKKQFALMGALLYQNIANRGRH